MQTSKKRGKRLGFSLEEEKDKQKECLIWQKNLMMRETCDC